MTTLHEERWKLINRLKEEVIIRTVKQFTDNLVKKIPSQVSVCYFERELVHGEIRRDRHGGGYSISVVYPKTFDPSLIRLSFDKHQNIHKKPFIQGGVVMWYDLVLDDLLQI